MNKIPVFAMYDGQCCTWNIMDAHKNCLFFGHIDELENWLVEHQATHQEYEERDVLATVTATDKVA